MEFVDIVGQFVQLKSPVGLKYLIYREAQIKYIHTSTYKISA
jgi:hypothetical protein